MTPDPVAWMKDCLEVMSALAEEFSRERPFAGLTIGICLYIEPKTAVLCSVLRAGPTW